ncbi:GNAT family N-acetyltransferase [Paenalcaligenes sp. Me131]|uniref:GNAT family N-acetyltransferase n=1 Tax=Paenalcaligenes sp. Me131 TaxID=3392636 RepID=UPI003D2A1CC4
MLSAITLPTTTAHSASTATDLQSATSELWRDPNAPSAHTQAQFADVINQYWQEPFVGRTIYSDEHLRIVINPQLDADEGVTILHTLSNTHTAIALLPHIAEALHSHGVLHSSEGLTADRIRMALAELGIVMHGADCLYYVPNDVRQAWLNEAENSAIRQLSPDDAMLFAELEYHTSDDDLDMAQVAIDDWAAFGVWEEQNGTLVGAASIYPWCNAPILDIGIFTLTTARGQGHATQLLRAVGRYAMAHHYELQYRSQADNHASIALAEAAGLALFGYWEIPTPHTPT